MQELGLTSREGRDGKLIAPILPNWYEAYKTGNRNHPQAYYGINTLVGKEIIASLRNGDVDLSYTARSELTSEQFGDLRAAVISAHRAYGVRKIPNGLAQSGEVAFDPDYWFNLNWNLAKKSIVRALAHVGRAIYPDNLAYQFIDIKHSRDNIEDRQIQSLVDDFQISSDYEVIFPVVVRMYEVAGDVLVTDEAKELSRRRRNIYHLMSGNFANEKAMNYEFQILRLIKDELVEKESMKDAEVHNFLSAITYSSRLDLIERLPVSIPETRIK